MLLSVSDSWTSTYFRSDRQFIKIQKRTSVNPTRFVHFLLSTDFYYSYIVSKIIIEDLLEVLTEMWATFEEETDQLRRPKAGCGQKK